MINWLLTPLSGISQHDIAPWAFWHARAMVLGWSILLPLGMLIARFFKVMPGQDWPRVLDNPIWWRAHVWLQITGVAVMSFGLLLAFGRGAMIGSAATLHHLLGWTIAAIGWIQTLGGAFRGSKGGPTDVAMRGDHYDMTRHRLIFEHIHKYLGWLTPPLVILATGIGLVMVDAPRWMVIVLGVWWLWLIAAFVMLQRAGRCIDTYQAIWGPDPSHPGNRRKPIGFGVVRRSLPSKAGEHV